MLVVQAVASVSLAHGALRHRAIALDPTALAFSTCSRFVRLSILRGRRGWCERWFAFHVYCMQAWRPAGSIIQSRGVRCQSTCNKQGGNPKRREEESGINCGVEPRSRSPTLGPRVTLYFATHASASLHLKVTRMVPKASAKMKRYS